MSANLPDTCSNCGIDIDPSRVDPSDDGVQCAECGTELELSDETRVNYKSPVVEDDDG